MHLLKAAWRNALDFCGMDAASTCYWPRWIVLRAVGAVYLIIFAGIIDEGAALVGPRGIAPMADFLRAIGPILPGFAQRFIVVPSLFWFSSSQAMMVALEWIGAIAAMALVLNLWPRMALFVCWSFFRSSPHGSSSLQQSSTP